MSLNGKLEENIYVRLATQIKKRNLKELSLEEKERIWETTYDILRTRNLPPSDLMTLTTNSNFLRDVGYDEQFWNIMGVKFADADKHYSTIWVAAAYDCLERIGSLEESK